jgi:hypothetical protein
VFEQVGIKNATFSLPGQGVEAVRSYIAAVFNRFESREIPRAKLLDKIKGLPPVIEGERTIDVKYKSLEEPEAAAPRTLTIANPLGGSQ